MSSQFRRSEAGHRSEGHDASFSSAWVTAQEAVARRGGTHGVTGGHGGDSAWGEARWAVRHRHRGRGRAVTKEDEGRRERVPGHTSPQCLTGPPRGHPVCRRGGRLEPRTPATGAFGHRPSDWSPSGGSGVVGGQPRAPGVSVAVRAPSYREFCFPPPQADSRLSLRSVERVPLRGRSRGRCDPCTPGRVAPPREGFRPVCSWASFLPPR